MQYIDPRELNDLASFAGRGGLGKGIATTDCIAESPEQLMFIQGDELILLRDLGKVVLASCEGVVGWVEKGQVEFDHVASTSSPRTIQLDVPASDAVPRTILTAPSPPVKPVDLPVEKTSKLDVAPPSLRNSKRVSGPFELDSPQQSPNLEQVNQTFFDQQQSLPSVPHKDEPTTDGDEKRESVTSVASSALGGIGGFMMGEDTSEDSHLQERDVEELSDGISPASASVETPTMSRSPTLSPKFAQDRPLSELDSDDDKMDTSDWDIYGDYARDSMYASKRFSQAAKRASRLQSPEADGSLSTEYSALAAARKALEGRSSPLAKSDPRPPKLEIDTGLKTPTGPAQAAAPSPIEGFTGRSLATELRLRIQRERAEAPADSSPHPPEPSIVVQSPSVPAFNVIADDSDDYEQTQTGNTSDITPTDSLHETESRVTSEAGHTPIESEESATSIRLHTPHSDDTINFRSVSPDELKAASMSTSLMESPMPLEDTPKMADSLPVPDSPEDLAAPPIRPPRRAPSPAPLSPSLGPPKPPGWPTDLNPPSSPWTPGSPASPHSVEATRSAVEAVKSTPEGRRPRGLTLVGKMESDLSAAKGPVPISFMIGGPGIPQTMPSMPKIMSNGVGLGFPTGRNSPVMPEARARSPLSPAPMPIPDDIANIRHVPSKYPAPARSVTQPQPDPSELAIAGPRPGFLAARPRSRSFSSAMFKGSRSESSSSLSKDAPPLPATPSTNSKSRSIFARKMSTPNVSTKSPVLSTGSMTPMLHPNTSTPSLPPSARSSSFSFSSKISKTPKKGSRALPSPVSHRDFEDTVNASGMDFELVQPKKLSSAPQSPASLMSPSSPGSMSGLRGEVDRMTISSSNTSLASRLLVETDEWGFLKDQSVTPEIYQSRSAAGDHRAVEQKWLSIISTPLLAGPPPKKIRKLVIESSIPSSLRGKVWAWFMVGVMSARVPGLYSELCGHERPSASDEEIEHDIASLWSDHSMFFSAASPGRQDLRSVLRAYSNFSPSGYTTPMCHLAGTLLIHCVAEDAFWLLSGLVNSSLKEYYSKDNIGLRTDQAVFEALVRGSEKDIANVFKEAGVKASDFLPKWYRQLFVRCLPWPTALRVIDAVVAEGPRFLLIASLTVLTLSKDRLMALPRNRAAILDYLANIPQDSLLLPENFMRSAEKVKFRDEDWKKLRASVEKEVAE